MKSKRAIFPFNKPPAPQMEEFLTVMEFFAFPAFLYHRQQQRIFGANSALLRLTAFTQDEFCALSLEHLFPDLHPKDLLSRKVESKAVKTGGLKTRNEQMIPVQLKPYSLSPHAPWMVIGLDVLAEKQRAEYLQQRHSALLSALNSICRVDDRINRQELLDTLIRLANVITGASSIAFYQTIPAVSPSEQEFFSKVAVFGEGDALPESIEAIDIPFLSQPLLWKPGRRAAADLFQYARRNGYRYLACAPVSTPHDDYGFIVAADHAQEPDEEILPLIEFLAHILAGHYENWNSTREMEIVSQEYRNDHHIFQKILENVQDGFVLLDTELQIQKVNPAAEQMLGYAGVEISRQPVQNVLIGAVNLIDALQLAVDGIETPSLGNVSLHRRDGQAFPVSIQVLPVIQDGANLGILVLLRDLSQENEIRIRTQQLEQRAFLGELTAIFAHEIRNPINNISLALQMMELELNQEDPNRSHIERLKQNRDRLIHLMDTVLSFSRSTNYQMTPTDLSGIIERVVLRWQPRMSREKVEARIQKPAIPVFINGNANALEQIFNNLIDNAIRAMKDTNGGVLTVKTDLSHGLPGQNLAHITISDTGPGIPKEYMEKVFQPFFTTDKQSGTGLGLAITQRIIIAHKGKIQVESFPGGGTVFTITFPAIKAL